MGGGFFFLVTDPSEAEARGTESWCLFTRKETNCCALLVLGTSENIVL